MQGMDSSHHLWLQIQTSDLLFIAHQLKKVFFCDLYLKSGNYKLKKQKSEY